jgi:glycosyltransferase involved in cell wall biosynthesis
MLSFKGYYQNEKNKKMLLYITIKVLCSINFFIILVFLKKKSFKAKNKSPKVSIFMPIYNKELFLNRSLNSILKQTIIDLEIITVNDCSTDNTLKVLKYFSSIDNRIKILNNDRNHGLLYSRAMGILNSTGEYLINLDPDDKLSNENDLERLYKIAKSRKLDLIQYEIERIWSINNNSLFYNDIKFNKRKKQKKTYNYSFIIKKNRTKALITNKFIRREIIFKAYNNFTKYIFNNKWNYHEDTIWHKLILKYSKLKLNFNEVIYIYFKNNPYSLLHNMRNQLEHKNRLYTFEMINKIENNRISKGINWLINYIKPTIKNDIESRKHLIRLIIRNIYNHKYGKYELKKINKKILNKLSNNKLIIIFDNKKYNYYNSNKFFNLYKFIEIINGKIIQTLNINNKMFNNYIDYIYKRDIFLGNKNICFNPNFKELISLFPKNKFFILTNDDNKQLLNLSKFHNIYLLNLNSNYSFLKFKTIVNT